MVSSTEAIALHEHVRNTLLFEIEAGKFARDSKLPSEAELCRRFSVSRITVRRAVADLEGMGMVRRRQGRGTFVTPQRATIGTMALGGFSDMLTGGALSRKVLHSEVIPAEEPVASRLGVREGAKLFHLVRLFMIDRIPHSIDDCYYSLQRFPGLDKKIDASTSTYQVLRDEYDVEFERFERTIGIAFTDEASSQWLDRPEHDPLITIDKVAQDADGDVIHVSLVQVVPSRLTLRIFSNVEHAEESMFGERRG